MSAPVISGITAGVTTVGFTETTRSITLPREADASAAMLWLMTCPDGIELSNT